MVIKDQYKYESFSFLTWDLIQSTYVSKELIPSQGSTSKALIPYTKPMTPMEFIKLEVEKSLSNGTISIEQIIPEKKIQRPISTTSTFIDNDLLTSTEKIVDKIFNKSSRIRREEMSDSNWCKSSMGYKSNSNLYPKISENSPIPFSNSFKIDCEKSPVFMPHAAFSKMLNGDEIVETLQSEASFTIATDKKPIVATYGCGPCVALGGYETTNKIAFIIHFSDAQEVRNSGGMILYNIDKLVKEKIASPIQLHLRGGIEGKSEDIIDAIKTWMKIREDLPMEITSEDILDNGRSFNGKSLSIDSRNGEVSDYNPLSNPKSKGMSDLNMLIALMSFHRPRICLAYSPSS